MNLDVSTDISVGKSWVIINCNGWPRIRPQIFSLPALSLPRHMKSAFWTRNFKFKKMIFILKFKNSNLKLFRWRKHFIAVKSFWLNYDSAGISFREITNLKISATSKFLAKKIFFIFKQTSKFWSDFFAEGLLKGPQCFVFKLLITLGRVAELSAASVKSVDWSPEDKTQCYTNIFSLTLLYARI